MRRELLFCDTLLIYLSQMYIWLTKWNTERRFYPDVHQTKYLCKKRVWDMGEDWVLWLFARPAHLWLEVLHGHNFALSIHHHYVPGLLQASVIMAFQPCCQFSRWDHCWEILILLRNYSDCLCILCVVFLCFWYHKSFHLIIVFLVHQLCL